MNLRPLGRSGLQVSPLTLGTMMFGGATEEPAARRIIDQAHDLGLNFIDTADVYNAGESERIVGKAIAAHADHWIVASKAGIGVSGGRAPANLQGSNRRYLHSALEQSLVRLNREHIDVYYLHRDDLNTPLEETVSALGVLIQQGKIRYWGVSNFRAWRIAEAVATAKALGVPPPIVCQPLYNIVNRQVELELLTAAAHHGLGVVPYSPLARGVLSGKYQPDVKPDPESRAGRQDRRLLETEWRPESLEIAKQLAAHAQSKGVSLVEFAIAWILKSTYITSAVVGPRTEEHFHTYLKSLDYVLDQTDEQLVESLVPPGHASTHGYIDIRFQVIGRALRP